VSDLSKKEVRAPDSFRALLMKVFKSLLGNKAANLVVLGVFIVGGVAYSAYNHYKQSQEEKAQAELFEVEQLLKKDQPDANPEAVPEPLKAEQIPDEAISMLDSVTQKYSGTNASSLAALRASELLEIKGDLQRAGQFAKSGVENSRSELIKGLARLRFATLQINQSKYSEATAEIQKVLDNDSLKSLHAEAQLRLAVSYELQSDLEKARELYSKIVASNGADPVGRTAKRYLHSLGKDAQIKAKE